MAKTVKRRNERGQLVGYCRVSTKEQNLDLQREALQAAGCTKIFEEKISGAKRGRPELEKLLDYVREGDTVCVYKLDRLARSTSQLLEMVEGFDQKGISFRTLTGVEIDTTTPSGKLVFTVFSALSEFERGLIRERTQAGIERAVANGVKLGRKPIDDEKADAIKRMLSEGASWTKITDEIEVSRRTVARQAKQMKVES